MSNLKNNIKDSIWYWLGYRKPFIINEEYKVELLFLDRNNNSAKIKVTNIKTNESSENSIDGVKDDN